MAKISPRWHQPSVGILKTRIEDLGWGQFLRIPAPGWGYLDLFWSKIGPHLCISSTSSLFEIATFLCYLKSGTTVEKITLFPFKLARERKMSSTVDPVNIDDTSELTILNEDPSSFPPSMAAGWSASFLVYVWAPKQASLFSAVQPEFVVVLLWSLDVGPGPRHSASWVSLGPPSRSNYDRKHRAMPLTHRYVGKMNISGVSQKASNSILKMPADSGPGNRIELGQKANLTGRPLSLSLSLSLWPPSSFPPFLFRPSNSSAWNMDKEICVSGLLIYSWCNGHFDVQYFPIFPALHYLRTWFSTIDTKIKVFNLHLLDFLLGCTTAPG